MRARASFGECLLCVIYFLNASIMDKAGNFSLQRSGEGSTGGSKEQLQFNKLVKEIEELERKNEEKAARFERLFEFYNNRLVPTEKIYAKTLMDTAARLAELHASPKLTEKEKEVVAEGIIELFDIAFRFILPNEEQIKLYDSFNEFSYQEELDAQIAEEKEEISSFLKSMDLDIDLDEYSNSSEDFLRLKAKVEEQLREKKERSASIPENPETHKAKPKTKKQIEKEEQRQMAEQMKLKSLREIYIGLVKLLHPDGETDEQKRMEKEEVMKQVTTAYENQDLPTLLRLELLWVNNEARNIDKLSRQKVNIYIDFLKERKKKLMAEGRLISRDPRYAPFAEEGNHSEKRGMNFIESRTDVVRSYITNIIVNVPIGPVATLERRKKSILKFLKANFGRSREEEMLFDILDEFFN